MFASENIHLVLFALLSKLFELCLVLLADLNQAQFLFSNLKQLVEKQNGEISQLHNKVVKLQMELSMLTDTNVEILGKYEMIEKEFILRDIK